MFPIARRHRRSVTGSSCSPSRNGVVGIASNSSGTSRMRGDSAVTGSARRYVVSGATDRCRGKAMTFRLGRGRGIGIHKRFGLRLAIERASSTRSTISGRGDSSRGRPAPPPVQSNQPAGVRRNVRTRLRFRDPGFLGKRLLAAPATGARSTGFCCRRGHFVGRKREAHGERSLDAPAATFLVAGDARLHFVSPQFRCRFRVDISAASSLEMCCSVMSWRNYSLCHAVPRPHGPQHRYELPRKARPSAQVHGAEAARLVRSNGATSVLQAGLEKHQSSVKPPRALRVLPESVQRAKLQGCADSNAFGEGTRGFR